MESVSGVPTGGYPPPEASAAILELLEREAVTFKGQGFPTTTPRPVYSPIAQEVIEVANMSEGPEKKAKEDKIIGKINEKLQLARSIADRLRPESYSVGVGFPFGIQVSFSWSTTKKTSVVY